MANQKNVLPLSMFKTYFYTISVVVFFSIAGFSAKPDWYEKESKNFIVIYREPHAYLIPHILQSGESALERLIEIFDYTPSEKIVIVTFDFNDYGSSGTMTVPHNSIRLDIAPFELGYENIPYNDRIKWLISHELVHIVIGDHASSVEQINRSLFSKVAPQQEQPLSVGFSLLTNQGRYTPLWHQEGIAVFLETWMNGGFGRVLGNFDEMYFRSLVAEKESFPTPDELDSKMQHESFLIGTLHYLYGTRFVSYLAASYGVEKLIAWYRPGTGDFYKGMEKKFEEIFGIDLQTAWQEFSQSEKRFQSENLQRLNSVQLTHVKKLYEKPLGWVTQAYIDKSGEKVVFGHHQSHQLTALISLDLNTQRMKRIGTLTSPSIIQVASTAYDTSSELFFYTTNNNQLYRDICVMSFETGKSRILFENVRVGQLTVSPVTHELWGIRHANARAALVYSAHPYQKLFPVIEFKLGDELQHLAVSPSGRYLAATLHQSNGQQAIIVADIAKLKNESRFLYQCVTEEGSPEFPSWSADEKYLYWNAYTNGVSNIYRSRHGSSEIQAVSHTLRGLFRPVYLSDDSLFAFEFSSKGFIPVLIPNQPAERLPAIQYFGQKVVEGNPQVVDWEVKTTSAQDNLVVDNDNLMETSYRGLSHLKPQFIIPVVSGFQDQTVFGLYSHLADPFYNHDLLLEFGFSNFQNNPNKPRFHFRGRYEYQRKYYIEIEHNASCFYDLFNQRKASLEGTKVLFGNTHYWKFDNPHNIKQTVEFSLYRGIQSINDNLIKVEYPDFVTFTTSLNSRNLRRAIGSVDSESGSEWAFTFSGTGVNFRKPLFVGALHGKWSHYHSWMQPHNILHLKLAAGYSSNKDNLPQGKFYFGGFGNQLLENKSVKQYREAFRLPGIPVHSLAADRFAKVVIENNLPPQRFSNVKFGQHSLSHVDASLFTQSLVVNSTNGKLWYNLGGQINFVFNHWFNLESTFSVGLAQAWNDHGQGSREWFVSLKLLKN